MGKDENVNCLHGLCAAFYIYLGIMDLLSFVILKGKHDQVTFELSENGSFGPFNILSLGLVMFRFS